MPTEVDTTLEAFRLHLPTYTIETDLRLVRTLKRIKIKAASMQWMAGRTFSNLERCTIIWPHYPETLAQTEVSTHISHTMIISHTMVITHMTIILHMMIMSSTLPNFPTRDILYDKSYLE